MPHEPPVESDGLLFLSVGVYMTGATLIIWAAYEFNPLIGRALLGLALMTLTGAAIRRLAK